MCAGDPGALRKYIEDARDLFMPSRPDRIAAIHKNGDFELVPIGASEAQEIADDHIVIHYNEIAGLQCGYAVIASVDGGKIETSREWLTALIRDRVGEQRLAVPDNLAWVTQLLR